MNREKIIIKTSIKGIIANVLLAVFKAIVGIAANSIAIVLDAVNNLSDVFSSLITIVGTKLAGKAPDKEHPYGHGRVEYITALAISMIILYAGFASLTESVKKIVNPVTPKYTLASIILVIVAIVVKVFLVLYVKKVGENVNSDSLIGSGKDALVDAIISFSTLVAATIFLVFGIRLEALIGIMISVVILKSGIEMLKNTLSQILGKRADKELAIAIKETINSYENVYGAYDLNLNDYGPDTYLGSVNIEVPDRMLAYEIDELSRKISKEIYEKYNVIITAIGIYSTNICNQRILKMREKISEIVHSYKTVNEMHGLYINEKGKTITFDIVIDFSDKQRNETFNKISEEVQNEYKDYKVNITLDTDISD